MIQLLNGDAFSIPLADESVHCCVTSPPYYGLRQYAGLDGGYGLEPTLDEYLANTVAWCREVWRVLRPDGSFWCNIGDSYYGNPNSGGGGKRVDGGTPERMDNIPFHKQPNLKPKDLMGVPWRVALALQADGWWLRSDIIWAKPNPMPESVTDRPTKAHEYLFLLTKSARYYYDADAVREAHAYDWTAHGKSMNALTTRGKYKGQAAGRNEDHTSFVSPPNPAGRNKRTVWTIATRPYSGAHFATYPPALVEPCIQAGTSEQGVCPECGDPWERVVERQNQSNYKDRKMAGKNEQDTMVLGSRGQQAPKGSGVSTYLAPLKNKTTGWRPTCKHDLDPIPATVLDPFAGSGTTLLVARELGRSGVGVDMSWQYLSENARERLSLTALDEWTNGKPGETVLSDLPMFGGLDE